MSWKHKFNNSKISTKKRTTMLKKSKSNERFAIYEQKQKTLNPKRIYILIFWTLEIYYLIIMTCKIKLVEDLNPNQRLANPNLEAFGQPCSKPRKKIPMHLLLLCKHLEI